MKKVKFLLVILIVTTASALTAQTTNPDTVCVNASGVEYFVNGTPGSSYSWDISGGGTIDSTQADTMIFVTWNSTPGTDTIYVTEIDSLGCVGDTSELPVTREPLPIADIADDSVTIGNCSPGIQIAPDTKDADMTYSWSPATGLSDASIADPIANPTDTTTYVLTVSSPYGCSVTDTITVNVAPAPVADAGTNDTICYGQTAQLDGSNSSGVNLSYSWTSVSGGSFSSNSVSPSVSPVDTTTYQLVVTDEYGCSDTSTVTVNVVPDVVADAGVKDSICEGETHFLTGTADNYSSVVWTTNGDGSFNGNTTLNPEYIPGPNDISSGSVTIEIEAKGIAPCGQTTDTVELIIHPKPNTPAIQKN
ncbi:MAG: PKD domain-containing protein [Bacteroidales bacterium]|nr:PKD domain-containing protein [Bacteroidales bacterium]MCF8327433.1 PKD domain-containing protein [Bacteroidales bacterium]